MKRNIPLSILSLAILLVVFAQCSKPASNLSLPPTLVHFIGDRTQSYQIASDPAPVYKIQLGITGVSSEARTISFDVSSPTGAVPGTHYSIVGGNTIEVPAGQATAEITVQGIYAPYTSGRKDTLVFSLREPSLSPASFSDTVKLVLRGPCFDGDIGDAELEGLLGNYDNTTDAGFSDWGPYRSTILSVTRLTATTARAVIRNVWDDGFGNVNFILDWTDPANTTIKVESPTITPADAGILSSTYDGMNLVIADHPSPGAASNNFSVCSGRLNLRYRLGVYDPGSNRILGYFSVVVTTIMQR